MKWYSPLHFVSQSYKNNTYYNKLNKEKIQKKRYFLRFGPLSEHFFDFFVFYECQHTFPVWCPIWVV